ncbi:unnamed protein product [Leptidea sinapis]|uniref:Uncharacterized protein n=1 Tax=Leptidea sinapis TaxID=189913 RepID=A0A5E4PVU5_9NEOP|nr:unnamed protein product [Leptidea sinapis]
MPGLGNHQPGDRDNEQPLLHCENIGGFVRRLRCSGAVHRWRACRPTSRDPSAFRRLSAVCSDTSPPQVWCHTRDTYRP